MNDRIRRGLGLLVVAVLGWLIAIGINQMGADTASRVVAAPAMIAGLVGLGLIAYGLLRPASD